MDWIKIPINEIILSSRKDWENYALIKYQALFLQLEQEPSDMQLKRVLSQKELKFVQSNKQVVSKLIQSQLEVVNKKRNHDKIKYRENNAVDKIPSSERNLTEIKDKTREYNKNNNSNELLQKVKNKNSKKDLDLSFVSSEYASCFNTWLEYKRGRGEKYKTQKSVEACYRHLRELSGLNPEIASLVVEQAMANNWAGLYALKIQAEGSKKSEDDEKWEKLFNGES